MATNIIHYLAFLLYLINVFHEIVLCIQQSLMVRDAVAALMGCFHGCGPRWLIPIDSADIHEDDFNDTNNEQEKLLF